MPEFIQSFTFLLTLLNPFLIVVYLTEIMRKLNYDQFAVVLLRAGTISSLVFCLFSILGDAIFSQVIQAQFASFQIFGGIVFLIISLQFIFQGNAAISALRGDSGNVAGAIAMPVFIGPGTISASVLAGKNLKAPVAIAAILLAVSLSVGIILLLKRLHDHVQIRDSRLIEGYVNIAGRVTALYVGTIAIEMVMRGLQTWTAKF